MLFGNICTIRKSSVVSTTNHHIPHIGNIKLSLFDFYSYRVKARYYCSKLESRFASLWDALGGIELVREFRFDKTRRWRADFASESAREKGTAT